MNRRIYSLKEFAQIFNVAHSTVKRWQIKGYIPDRRTENKWRYFLDKDIKAIRNIQKEQPTKIYSKLEQYEQTKATR